MEHFVHITGSVPSDAGDETIKLVLDTVEALADALLQRNLGLVALLGASDNSATIPFDNVIIEAAARYVSDRRVDEVVLKMVSNLGKSMNRFSSDTIDYLDLLGRCYENIYLYNEPWTGGNIRRRQADISDAAIIIGGSKGVCDTANFLLNSMPPKIVEVVEIRGLQSGLSEATMGVIRGLSSEKREVFNGNGVKVVANDVAESLCSSISRRSRGLRGFLWMLRRLYLSSPFPAWVSAISGVIRFLSTKEISNV